MSSTKRFYYWLQDYFGIALIGIAFFSTSVFAANFAALAYSKSTGKYGLGQSTESFRESFDFAMEKCATEDCFVRVSVQDGCLAFARDEKWDGLGFAADASLGLAQERAVYLCKRPWNNQCEVVFQFCTEEDK